MANTKKMAVKQEEAIKHFSFEAQEEVESVPFSLDYKRNGAVETEVFRIVPKGDSARMLNIAALQRKVSKDRGSKNGSISANLAGSLTDNILSILRTSMDDSDGLVNSRWGIEPKENKDGSMFFPGPDGKKYAVDDNKAIEKFEDKSNWSSKRRWLYLMDEDDDAEISQQVILNIFNWYGGLTAKRPTQPQA